MDSQDKNPPKHDDLLTPEELRLLSEALGDGFRSILLSSGELLELTDIVPDVFWGTKLEASEEDKTRFRAFAEEHRAEGWSDDEILEKYLDLLEKELPDDVPKWRGSNPFDFDNNNIEKFFIDRCDNSLGDLTTMLTKNGGNSDYIDLIEVFPPFSRTWFEIHIVNELSVLRTLFNDFQRQIGHPAYAWVLAIMRRAGAVGRLIESYRWRFAYGHHALRGQKVVKSAVAGGRARAKELSAPSIAILKDMAELIKQGHSISRAAALVHARGMGASDQANIKLWHRHKTK